MVLLESSNSPILKSAVVFLLAIRMASGWGPEGHKITGRIAEKYLTSRAKRAVGKILGPDRNLPGITNIADEVRAKKPETGPWHYINIPITETVFDRAKYCPQGQCVVAAIERARDRLKSPGGSADERYEALYNLVHFLGDIHQPLHAGDRGDRGGNEVKVELLGQPSNLHRVWDSGLLDTLHGDWEVLSNRLGKISRAKRRTWSGGTPQSWAMESHDLARDVAYRFETPGSGPVLLGDDYVKRSLPVAEQRLAQAGIRLAHVLNQVFR
ncbi:MAG: S1/P1 nuclease [Acidobacteria bacterium]|nr:S1/P1 nuclease [Acidobacteriota bacterium]